MDFRILGPLEVYDGDRLVALGGAKQRALLALLLLNANEVVSSDRLIDELWGADRLEGASKALQVAVSRLRRALEPERSAGNTGDLLVTRPPGYVLQLGLASSTSIASRTKLAGGPEGLAAGDAGAGGRGARRRARPVARSAAGRPRLRIVLPGRDHPPRGASGHGGRGPDRRRAGARPPRDLVAQLQDLVQGHPLRERLREQLMLALYRSGRQADALEVYQDARRALTEELGIEPGRELRELQQAILRQDPTLDRRTHAGPPADSGAAATSEPSRGAFVGRERELAELAGALEDALAGRGRPGPAGGRARDRQEPARRRAAGQGRALEARACSWAAAGRRAAPPPTGRGCSRCAPTSAMRSPTRCGRSSGRGAAELAQLVARAARAVPRAAGAAGARSEGARFRLFEAASAFLRTRRRRGRWCSCSTTCTPRTSPRCFCSGSSLARWPTAACSWCVPSATSTRPCASR